MASYTEALSSVQTGLATLGWMSVALSGIEGAALLVVWIWARDQVAHLRAEHADLLRELRHPSLDARALSEAEVAVDAAVREIQEARTEIRMLAEVAREVAAVGGVDHVTVTGGPG